MSKKYIDLREEVLKFQERHHLSQRSVGRLVAEKRGVPWTPHVQQTMISRIVNRRTKNRYLVIAVCEVIGIDPSLVDPRYFDSRPEKKSWTSIPPELMDFDFGRIFSVLRRDGHTINFKLIQEVVRRVKDVHKAKGKKKISISSVVTRKIKENHKNAAH